MECTELSEDSTDSNDRSFYEQILNDTLPSALMMGVDYELFWTLNPKSLEPFVKAFELKQQYDDTIAWLGGIYVRYAIASSFNKEIKYPMDTLLESHKKDIETDDSEIRQQIIKERFLKQARQLNSRFKKGGADG